MNTCREVIDFLMDYLNGDLDAATRASFEKHIGVCPPCVTFMKTYEETIRMGRAALCEDTEAPPPLPPELVKAILAAKGASP